jgi:hypothetical protein
MQVSRLPSLSATIRAGALAGVSGGLAEILWIASYGTLTGKDVGAVARSISGVVRGVVPQLALLTTEPLGSGITIHMVAAVAMGIGLTLAWHSISTRCSSIANPSAFMLPALCAVWGINFFVILPLMSSVFLDLHTNFVELIPYPVSLASKLLFGLSAAAVLDRETGWSGARVTTWGEMP